MNIKSIVFRQWHGIAFYRVLYVVLKWLNPFSLMTLTRLINFLSETTYRLCDCVIFEIMEFSVTWSSQKFENALKIIVGDVTHWVVRVIFCCKKWLLGRKMLQEIFCCVKRIRKSKDASATNLSSGLMLSLWAPHE